LYNLTSPIENTLDGLALNLSFDVILKVLELQRESMFSMAEKRDLALELLLQNPKKLSKYSSIQKTDLLRRIFDEHVFTGKKRSPGNDTKLFDFEQDAEFIFASFLQAYGIDLIERQGKLPWQKFRALFRGLPEDTKIREVMEIRGKKLPKPTKYNGEDIKALREAKRFYALDVSAEEAEQQFQRGLDRLANTLAGRAKKAGETDGRR